MNRAFVEVLFDSPQERASPEKLAGAQRCQGRNGFVREVSQDVIPLLAMPPPQIRRVGPYEGQSDPVPAASPASQTYRFRFLDQARYALLHKATPSLLISSSGLQPASVGQRPPSGLHDVFASGYAVYLVEVDKSLAAFYHALHAFL